MEIQFREGDGQADWGHVRVTGNGTSGRSVATRVLEPLAIDTETTWFSDVVDSFFVKSGNGRRRAQADAIATDYAPFAAEVGLPPAKLPARPGVDELVDLALAEHTGRLRTELAQAAAAVVVTLGEEARRVLHDLADEATGPPTLPLDGRCLVGATAATYGEAGTATLGSSEVLWYALVHPGQRSRTWTDMHNAWIDRRHG